MKKSVVIIIALIYVAAVALVSFFGLAHKTFDEVVYVSDIKLTSPGIKPAPSDVPILENGEKEYDYYVVIRPEENGLRKFQVEYRVEPDNATNKDIVITANADDLADNGVTIDEFNVITFSKRGSITVQIIPEDHSLPNPIKLKIYAY